MSVLLPLVASAVACGGSVASVGGGSSGGGGGDGSSSSSSSSSGGGGSSSSSTSSTSSGGSTSSSGGSSSGTVPMTINLCNASGEYHRLDNVTPASSVEYMELRDEYTAGDPGPGVLVESAGLECASASDKPACVQAVNDAYTAGWTVSDIGLARPRERFLLTTNGDSLEFQTSVADLTSFLGTIDNAKDAALLVTATDKYRINCQDGPQARKTTTGWEIAAETGTTCGANEALEQHILSVTTNGTVSIVSTKVIKPGDPNCAFGRRPVGLADTPQSGAESALARFFADAAYLEAVSVFAFERLEAELRALGASDALVDAAIASRHEEVRHARMTSSLARRFGAEPADPRMPDGPIVRSPFEIALENAVEGCVRETYGALVAHYQARTAEDHAIACIMQVIAEDETRHASLAWDVAAWLEPRLTADERRRIDAARAQAIADLRVELAKPVDEELATLAGMPRPADALTLLDALDTNHLRVAA